jgi:hypothetical protein
MSWTVSAVPHDHRFGARSFGTITRQGGFIPPTLCTTLRDPSRLSDPRYVAEPKFDGQRAQIHVAGGRTVAAYSRPGRSLLAHAGLAWLHDVQWPVGYAVLDGEVCGDTGSDGIQTVLEARCRRDAVTSFLAFDVLSVGGHRRRAGLQAHCGRARVGRCRPALVTLDRAARRRGHCAQGSTGALPCWRAVPGMAQGQGIGSRSECKCWTARLPWLSGAIGVTRLGCSTRTHALASSRRLTSSRRLRRSSQGSAITSRRSAGARH